MLHSQSLCYCEEPHPTHLQLPFCNQAEGSAALRVRLRVSTITAIYQKPKSPRDCCCLSGFAIYCWMCTVVCLLAMYFSPNKTIFACSYILCIWKSYSKADSFTNKWKNATKKGIKNKNSWKEVVCILYFTFVELLCFLQLWFLLLFSLQH